MQNIIFAKYSNDRDAKFNIITEIVKENSGKKWVLKRPSTREAEAHVDHIVANCKKLECQYRGTAIEIADVIKVDRGVRIAWVEGEAFSEYLDRFLMRGEMDQWKDAVKKYFDCLFRHKEKGDILTEEFESIFGSYNRGDGVEIIENIDIDALFSNVIYQDGRWVIYDCEWMMPFAIPVKFMVYRCLYYYINTQSRNELSLGGVYEEFGITEEQCLTFEKMEKNLQNYITGSCKPMWQLYYNIHGEILDMRALQERKVRQMRAQVFYDYGDGFSERNSEKIITRKLEDESYVVCIKIPENVVAIRFDPADGACIIQSISVKETGGQDISFITNGCLVQEGMYLFLHDDPQIIIRRKFAAESIKFEYALKFFDDPDRLAITKTDLYLKEFQQLLEQEKKQNQNLLQMKETHISNLEQEKKQNQNLLQMKETHISNLEQMLIELRQHCESIEMENQRLGEKIHKVYRAIKNPFYGCYLVMRKLVRKVKRIVDVQAELNYEKKHGHKRFAPSEYRYDKWIENVEENYETEEKFSYQPKISIIVPVYNVSDYHLIECIESVLKQSYLNWELCIADDASTWKNVKKTLKRYENNEKIHIIYRQENGHISKCTNTALKSATGDFVAFLDCDDTLSKNALYEVVKKLNQDKTLDMIYSDEDKIDSRGRNRHMPHFKPDWSPDTLLSLMYTCHLSVYRKCIVDELGGYREGYEGSQDYDFVLRFTEKTNRIGHIPKILYHWREREESTASSADAKPYIIEATRKSKETAIARRGIAAKVEQIDNSNWFRIVYKVIGNPKVSIIIPSKDNFEILERCIRSIYQITSYKNFEIVLIDNGSEEENRKKYSNLSSEYGFTYYYEVMDFNFSKMCNMAAKMAAGDYYLLLNDDTEVLYPEWLERMLGQAMQSHTGAVGAKLLYPDKENIQHIGVINIGPGPIHAFTKCTDAISHYFERNRLDYNYIAVTAACMLVSKEKYWEVGGFDEEFAVAFNDVDFCYKLLEKGYYNVARMDAILVHHESISRGIDLVDKSKMKRLNNERDLLYARHPMYKAYDPFYNINLVQDDVTFANGYENILREPNPICEIEKLPLGSNKVIGYIDTFKEGRLLFIEGWCYYRGHKTNNGIRTKVLLYNQQKKYEIATMKVRRMDVANSVPKEHGIEFCGFRCNIDKEKIESGDYKVGLVCNERCLLLDNCINI